MAAMDFKVLLEPDEDGGYVVVCPSLQGCYSQEYIAKFVLSHPHASVLNQEEVWVQLFRIRAWHAQVAL